MFFEDFNRDKMFIADFVKRNNFRQDNTHFLRYQLSTSQDPQGLIRDFLSTPKFGDVMIISDVVIQNNEDAFLNACMCQIKDDHRRFYTLHEIISFTKDYGTLYAYHHIVEEVDVDKLLSPIKSQKKKDEIYQIFSELPLPVKAMMLLEERDKKPVSFIVNVGVMIFMKRLVDPFADMMR